jgi:hypothetical protein
MSRKDLLEGIPGNHYHFDIKDTHMPYRSDPIPDDVCYYSIDVEYHMGQEFRRLLAGGRPCIAYTMMPTKAADDMGEQNFRFAPDGKIVLTVTSRTYIHHIWDYSTDTVVVSDGIWWTTVAVERRHISEHRGIVLLAPLQRVLAPVAFSLGWTMDEELFRYDPVRVRGSETWAVVKTVRADGCSISVAPVDGVTITSATVPQSKFDALQSNAAIDGNKQTGATVGAILGFTKDIDRTVVNIIRRYFAADPKGPSIPQLVCKNNLSYTRRVGWYEEAQPTCIPFMSALHDGGYNPSKRGEDLAWGATHRIFKQQSAAKPPQPSKAFREFCNEFVDSFVKLVGPLAPLDPDEVLEKQVGAARKVRFLNELNDLTQRNSIDPFTKAECSSGIKDPRLICAVQQGGKVASVSYACSLTTRMQELGITAAIDPLTLSEKVVRNACSAVAAIVTDLKRADGSVTHWSRCLIQFPIYMAIFRASLNDCLQMVQTGKEIVIRDLVDNIILEGCTGWAEISGCGFTSLDHTITGKAVYYCALRKLGVSPTEAFMRAVYGLQLGDDATGFTLEADPFGPEVLGKVWASFYRQIGMQLDIEMIVERGNPFQFLSRWWNPWDGDPSSMCDLRRSMMKFHMAPRSASTPEAKLIEKATAFRLTDGNTPIIGEFVNYTLRWAISQGLKIPDVCRPELSWFGQYEESVQFPNELSDWMEDKASEYDEFNYPLLKEAISKDTSPLEFPCCVTQREVEPTNQPVILNDEHVGQGEDTATRIDKRPNPASLQEVKDVLTRRSKDEQARKGGKKKKVAGKKSP